MIIPQGTVTDNYRIKPYHKLISLVPSISWLLFDLQLQKNIKGITKFCAAKDNQHLGYPIIGGTKNPSIQKIKLINPDLILANKEENRKEDIEKLAKHHVVYLSDIHDLKSMNEMIHEISILTGTAIMGQDFITQIKLKFDSFIASKNIKSPIQVAYLIWKDPLMTIGSDTFIHYMLHIAGFRNCYTEMKRYPVITYDELIERNPDLVLLSSEPYPFTEKHLDEFMSLNTRLVDGRMFSWYGTFILQSFEYLNAFKKSLNSNI